MTAPKNKKSLTLKAHAKVNLYLKVGPPASSGYHPIETIFQEISLSDVLRFSLTQGPVSMTASSQSIPVDRNNLVVKALLALKKKLKVKKGMRVHLEKNIPVGAGLGGGSSDAAAALLAGWRLWQNQKTVPPMLFDLAKKLGADVPFFLMGGTAWATGIGEKLRSLPKGNRKWMVLVYPHVHVSTAKAYRLLDQLRNKKGEDRPGVFNSFEPIILKAFPKIRQAHSALQSLGCTSVLLSGSGSSVFGFAQSKEKGKRVLNKLKSYPWKAFLIHTI